jgi:hypothetical protein
MARLRHDDQLAADRLVVDHLIQERRHVGPTVKFWAQRDTCAPLDEALIVGGGQRHKVTSDEGAILLWRLVEFVFGQALSRLGWDLEAIVLL